MIASFAPTTHRFVCALRRRIALIRVAESLGISLAVAAGAGLVLMPILWWDGRSGLPVAVAMLILGGACGITWGVARRPTRFEAAVEADRQLQLHDLLATVLMIDPGKSSDLTTPQWLESIAAMSEHRCARLRPSAIIVSRLGLRGWGGVGVLTALLVAVGLFTAHPVDVNAAASPGSFQAIAQAPPQRQSGGEVLPATARPPGPGGADEESRRDFHLEESADLSDPSQSIASATASVHSNAGADSRGAGVGAATTPVPQSAASPKSLAIGDAPPTSSGRPGSGNGQADSRAAVAGDNNSMTAVDGAPGRQLPPWTSGDWPTDTDAALQGIDSGRVPGSAVDLVRDYFQHDTDQSKP